MRSRNSGYGNDAVASQSEHILISALSSSSSLDFCDSWLVDSGASRHFSGYCEFLSNLVERESNLKIILRDNSTHLMKGFDLLNFIWTAGNSFFFMMLCMFWD